MIIVFYRTILIILYPLIVLFMLYRRIIGKEDKNRILERFGITKVKRPEGKLVWFNAVSIGEINSAWTIIKQLNENRNLTILVTTTTLTSSEIVAGKIEKLKNKDKVIHQFAPIDLTSAIYFFIKRWKPNLLINIESEFWPNLFAIVAKYCPIVVLNGKMSKKSFRFWYKHKNLKELVFSKIDVCFAQSKNDYKRFLMLGIQRVKFLGNIKFFAEKCDINEELYEILIRKVTNRHIWLANCTHAEEEELIIETHKLLKQKYDDILTFMVIRHPNRVGHIVNMLDKSGISYSLTSKNYSVDNRINCSIADGIEFYIHDKLGSLGTFFKLCRIVTMCGSFRRGIGGHNPAEAMKFDCCILTGPCIENNYILFKELLENNACIVLDKDDADTLAKQIGYLFDNPEKVKLLSDNAYRKSLEYSHISSEIIDLIGERVG